MSPGRQLFSSCLKCNIFTLSYFLSYPGLHDCPQLSLKPTISMVYLLFCIPRYKGLSPACGFTRRRPSEIQPIFCPGSAGSATVSGVAFTYCTGRKQSPFPFLQPTGNSYQSFLLPLEPRPGKALGSKKISEQAAIDQGKSHAVRYVASAW